ncbi:uracil phosphoribosyltransferase [Patescibacteria group bacterium]
MSKIFILEHPVADCIITEIRDKNTTHRPMRRLFERLTTLITSEATRYLPTEQIKVESPMQKTVGFQLSGEVAVVPILRAGNAMLNAFLQVLPDARIGYLGMSRDEKTLKPTTYLDGVSEIAEDADRIIRTFVIDPMLATGGSGSRACTILKEKGIKRIVMICLFAAPEGIAKMQEDHPDIDIYVAQRDECLNDVGFILPGIGDAGDRYCGT